MPRRRNPTDRPAPAARKERVLHARIPEQLDDRLKDQASRLGVSVSTMVRNVLSNTFDLVGGIVSDSARLAYGPPSAEAKRAAEPPSRALPETVIAWQPSVLNCNGVCDRCNALLARGSSAAIGLPVSTRPVFLCQACLTALQQEVGVE